MEDYDKLMVGDQSTDGRIIIADKDRLCYLVKSGSKGSFSIRTISKQLLGEFIDYYRKNPNKKAEDARVERTRQKRESSRIFSYRKPFA